MGSLLDQPHIQHGPKTEVNMMFLSVSVCVIVVYSAKHFAPISPDERDNVLLPRCICV